MLLCTVFAFSYYNLVCAIPLFLETPFLQDQTFNQLSQAEESQSQEKAFEPEESINQESNTTSDLNGFLEIFTVHNRTAKSTHPCVSGIVKEFDYCRNSIVVKVQCKRAHPACNHMIPIHSIPKCQTVYGYRNSNFVNKCSSLPIDCKCAD